jgi:hypothetical protein
MLNGGGHWSILYPCNTIDEFKESIAPLPIADSLKDYPPPEKLSLSVIEGKPSKNLLNNLPVNNNPQDIKAKIQEFNDLFQTYKKPNILKKNKDDYTDFFDVNDSSTSYVLKVAYDQWYRVNHDEDYNTQLSNIEDSINTLKSYMD